MYRVSTRVSQGTVAAPGNIWYTNRIRTGVPNALGFPGALV
jgi:hypothetical protein